MYIFKSYSLIANYSFIRVLEKIVWNLKDIRKGSRVKQKERQLGIILLVQRYILFL